MAVTEIKNNISFDTSKVEFICPVCKSKKFLDVPKSVIAEAKQLTTMSIARGLVCDHQFQAFVDKEFHVRGYQKVDFEFDIPIKENSSLRGPKQVDDELFESLVLEGNFLEYRPKVLRNNKDQSDSHKSNMSLKDIYDEFWEFIDENNEKFKAFIEKDLRRS
jgi:hypothetical protein